MLLSKEYVGYLAREVTKKLIAGKLIETKATAAVGEKVHAAILEEFSLEDRINDEVRVILEAYSAEMQKDGSQLSGDVPQSEERTGAQVQGGAVRVSRDKVNKVAHVVTDALADMDDVDFIEDRNTIRLEVRKILEEVLNQEEKIDQAARHKIENQKRTILEGSQEWDILYRKYYNEEVKKLGM
jgi:hypothetical protein